MARPIKETPALTGKDAERFLVDVAEAKPVSKEAKQHAKNVFERFKAIATFAL
jgi:hypothetical protein